MHNRRESVLPHHRWKHPDYGVGLAIEGDALADDTLRASKPALPRDVAQQRDGGRCRLVVRGTDRPAGHRVDSEDVQQVSADHLPGNLLGWPLPVRAIVVTRVATNSS